MNFKEDSNPSEIALFFKVVLLLSVFILKHNNTQSIGTDLTIVDNLFHLGIHCDLSLGYYTFPYSIVDYY